MRNSQPPATHRPSKGSSISGCSCI
jgi:hypothetical protein